MRRSAINFFLSGVCGLLSISVIGSAGRADESPRATSFQTTVNPTTAKPESTSANLQDVASVAPSLFASEASLIEPAHAIPSHPAAKPSGVQRELLHSAAIVSPAPKLTMPKFQTVLMDVTAYCPCAKCCGARAHGITASGFPVSHDAGLFVAADPRVPFHTKLIIPGYANNQPVEVLDRGGAIKGARLDVFFPTHEQALQWGRRKIEVLIEQ